MNSPPDRRAVLAWTSLGVVAALTADALRAAGALADPEIGGPAEAGFLAVSRVLTGRDDLDPVLGARLRAAFGSVAPDAARAIDQLRDLDPTAPDAEVLMASVRGAGLEAAALALVAAWFTGTVSSGTQARTIAYADALMYATVADGLAPPTYVLGGPAWWVADPPPAGVSRPTPKPAPTAPVTGSPSPQQTPAPPSLRDRSGGRQ